MKISQSIMHVELSSSIPNLTASGSSVQVQCIGSRDISILKQNIAVVVGDDDFQIIPRSECNSGS